MFLQEAKHENKGREKLNTRKKSTTLLSLPEFKIPTFHI